MEMIDRKTTNSELEGLISRLRNEDASYARISRFLQILYWMFIPFYVVMTVRHYLDNESVNQLIGGTGMVLSFLILAIFFGRYYKEYNYVDYSLPVVVMLKKAAYRYKPFQLRLIWVVLAMGLLDTGLFFGNIDEGRAMETQVFFIGAIIAAFAIGMILWYFRYKPLRDMALKLIAEIEGK